MPTVLQFRRGTSAQNDSFTGAAGEVSIDTDNDSIRIHDGVTAGGVEIAGNLTAGATSGNGISGSASSGTFTVTSNATDANTGSTTVFRDTNGNFSAGTITASLSGNASTATTLSTARTIGGVSFNGSANIDLPGVNTSGNQNTSGNASTATVATNITATANNSTNETVYLTFVDGATGTQGIETDTALTYNPSTNVLSTTASQSQYADLAENYLADNEYPIGTVLEIGGDAEVTVALPDSYKVVGTVSEAPGYLMNSALEGEHVVPVAYIGRVPCRVKGTVNRGDFLVVGDTPGVAVAKHPINILVGQAVGKALESHTGDEGLIEILVGRL